MMASKGSVTQVIGAVVDVQVSPRDPRFGPGRLSPGALWWLETHALRFVCGWE